VLIANADDLGASPRVTKAILECVDAGAISSISAMVWMHGTSRAADEVRGRGLPIGLHLNLTMPFDDPDVPGGPMERQRLLTTLLTKDSWMEPPDLSGVESVVHTAVAEQLAEFRARFGEPTHIDGHHHVHLNGAVLEAVPADLPVRAVPRQPAAALDEPGAWERTLRRRFVTPDLSLALEQLHPGAEGPGLEVLQLARDRTVEVVAHPAQPADRELLLSDEWRAAVAGLALGSYRDLVG